jgi:hypothetical protein
MKTKRCNPTKPASVREAETAWPLITAYLDLAERHAELLAERVERTRAELAKAEAALISKLEEEPCEAVRIVREAILNASAPAIFKQ